MSPEMQNVLYHRLTADDLPRQPDIHTVSLTFNCLCALAARFIKTMLQPARGWGGWSSPLPSKHTLHYSPTPLRLWSQRSGRLYKVIALHFKLLSLSPSLNAWQPEPHTSQCYMLIYHNEKICSIFSHDFSRTNPKDILLFLCVNTGLKIKDYIFLDSLDNCNNSLISVQYQLYVGRNEGWMVTNHMFLGLSCTAGILANYKREDWKNNKIWHPTGSCVVFTLRTTPTCNLQWPMIYYAY